jgi:isoquinoline 1-oxidoreductase alpha subunit
MRIKRDKKAPGRRERNGFPCKGDVPMVALTVNGLRHEVDAAPDTPLLWILREHLKLTGTKFGCGIAACGACTVHIEGEAVRSCSMPVSLVDGKAVTTIEGLSPDRSHPLQKAWIAEQVPQCGYCQSGQIMQAATLLAANKNPSRDDIVAHMDGNICRCGTYLRIISAIERAAREG